MYATVAWILQILLFDITGLCFKVTSVSWKRSVPPAVAGGSNPADQKSIANFQMLIVDPPATAGGTDCSKNLSWTTDTF